MEKGQIIWKDSSPYPELQRYFIEEAENNTDEYLKRYKNFKASANGQYINADLMKETFNVYASSPANRKAYNLTIHNSAAVLSNELFKQMLETESIKNCIFLTGAPGAGKIISQKVKTNKEVEEKIRERSSF